MLVLIGKSKLFLARLAYQPASEFFVCLGALCKILYSVYFQNSTLSGVHHIPGPYINTYNEVSRKQEKIERI